MHLYLHLGPYSHIKAALHTHKHTQQLTKHIDMTPITNLSPTLNFQTSVSLSFHYIFSFQQKRFKNSKTEGTALENLFMKLLHNHINSNTNTYKRLRDYVPIIHHNIHQIHVIGRTLSVN
jgi:hypothetical protein